MLRLSVMTLSMIFLTVALHAQEKTRVDLLISRLGDPSFRVREDATRQLIALGIPARSAVLKASTSTNPEIRLRAQAILRQLEESPEPFLADLKSRDPAERLRAIQELGRLGPKAKVAVPNLLELANRKDEPTRDEAIVALLRIAPEDKRIAGLHPVKASVNGKYTKLLRRIHVPNDVVSYGEFRDWGHYTGTSYAGHNDLPAGHWVYVEPHWYIWGEMNIP